MQDSDRNPHFNQEDLYFHFPCLIHATSAWRRPIKLKHVERKVYTIKHILNVIHAVKWDKSNLWNHKLAHTNTDMRHQCSTTDQIIGLSYCGHATALPIRSTYTNTTWTTTCGHLFYRKIYWKKTSRLKHANGAPRYIHQYISIKFNINTTSFYDIYVVQQDTRSVLTFRNLASHI